MNDDHEMRCSGPTHIPMTASEIADAPMPGKAKNAAQEAIKLVLGDRNSSYGDPRDDYAKTAKIWSGLLNAKLKEDITPEEALLMMVGLKLSREVHKHKPDNIIDAHGYLLCYEWTRSGVRPSDGESASREGSVIDAAYRLADELSIEPALGYKLVTQGFLSTAALEGVTEEDLESIGFSKGQALIIVSRVKK